MYHRVKSSSKLIDSSSSTAIAFPASTVDAVSFKSSNRMNPSASSTHLGASDRGGTEKTPKSKSKNRDQEPSPTAAATPLKSSKDHRSPSRERKHTKAPSISESLADSTDSKDQASPRTEKPTRVPSSSAFKETRERLSARELNVPSSISEKERDGEKTLRKKKSSKDRKSMAIEPSIAAALAADNASNTHSSMDSIPPPSHANVELNSSGSITKTKGDYITSSSSNLSLRGSKRGLRSEYGSKRGLSAVATFRHVPELPLEEVDSVSGPLESSSKGTPTGERSPYSHSTKDVKRHYKDASKQLSPISPRDSSSSSSKDKHKSRDHREIASQSLRPAKSKGSAEQPEKKSKSRRRSDSLDASAGTVGTLATSSATTNSQSTYVVHEDAASFLSFPVPTPPPSSSVPEPPPVPQSSNKRRSPKARPRSSSKASNNSSEGLVDEGTAPSRKSPSRSPERSAHPMSSSQPSTGSPPEGLPLDAASGKKSRSSKHIASPLKLNESDPAKHGAQVFSTSSPRKRDRAARNSLATGLDRSELAKLSKRSGGLTDIHLSPKDSNFGHERRRSEDGPLDSLDDSHDRSSDLDSGSYDEFSGQRTSSVTTKGHWGKTSRQNQSGHLDGRKLRGISEGTSADFVEEETYKSHRVIPNSQYQIDTVRDDPGHITNTASNELAFERWLHESLNAIPGGNPHDGTIVHFLPVDGEPISNIFFLTIKFEYADSKELSSVRIIITHEDRDDRMFISTAQLRQGSGRSIFKGSSRRQVSTGKLLEYIDPHLNKNNMRRIKAHDVLLNGLLTLTRLRLSYCHADHHFKVGVVNWTGDKDDETTMSHAGTPAFNEFVNVLGETVALENWERFGGGLDVTTRCMDGPSSVFTEWKGNEVMFHVAPLMQCSAHQKKVHIGNDTLVIVFVDSKKPFKVDYLHSKFNQVFIIVSVETDEAVIAKASQNAPYYSLHSPTPKNAPLGIAALGGFASSSKGDASTATTSTATTSSKKKRGNGAASMPNTNALITSPSGTTTAPNSPPMIVKPSRVVGAGSPPPQASPAPSAGSSVASSRRGSIGFVDRSSSSSPSSTPLGPGTSAPHRASSLVAGLDILADDEEDSENDSGAQGDDESPIRARSRRRRGTISGASSLDRSSPATDEFYDAIDPDVELRLGTLDLAVHDFTSSAHSDPRSKSRTLSVDPIDTSYGGGGSGSSTPAPRERSETKESIKEHKEPKEPKEPKEHKEHKERKEKDKHREEKEDRKEDRKEKDKEHKDKEPKDHHRRGESSPAVAPPPSASSSIPPSSESAPNIKQPKPQHSSPPTLRNAGDYSSLGSKTPKQSRPNSISELPEGAVAPLSSSGSSHAKPGASSPPKGSGTSPKGVAVDLANVATPSAPGGKKRTRRGSGMESIPNPADSTGSGSQLPPSPRGGSGGVPIQPTIVEPTAAAGGDRRRRTSKHKPDVAHQQHNLLPPSTDHIPYTDTFYRVTVLRRSGIESFRPKLPWPAVMQSGPDFREWLLSKVTTGMVAAFLSPNFQDRVLTNRGIYVRNLILQSNNTDS